MTIRFVDMSADMEYEKDLERYQTKVKELSGKPFSPDQKWPEMPKEPDPFIDSMDPGLKNKNEPFGASPRDPRAFSGDPMSRDLRDFDGNSQSEVEGYESNWSVGDLGDTRSAAPFTTKKG